MTNVAVLLSGGMDSTTALAQAIADGATNILALSLKYGSRHSAHEIHSAAEVVDWYRRRNYEISHYVLSLPNIFQGAGSSLMGEVELPRTEYKDPVTEGPTNTEVPFRNANLLSVATTLALTHQMGLVYFAAHASDYNHWAYPDCSPEFIGAMANAIYVGTMGRVRLVAPFMHMSKADIVTRAAILEAPLHLTWSCYDSGLLQCGQCPTCRERISAFATAGIADPVSYLVPQNWDGFEAFPTAEEDFDEE